MTDPPCCDRCGCNDLRESGKRSVWGVESVQFRCDHCGAESSVSAEDLAMERKAATMPEPVIEAKWPRTRCPKCGGRDTPVKSTRGRLRWHRCDDCGERFKSAERE